MTSGELHVTASNDAYTYASTALLHLANDICDIQRGERQRMFL